MLVAGEMKFGDITLRAQRHDPGGGWAGDRGPRHGCPGVHERDAAAVDVEQLPGGGFKVLDHKFHNAVWEARAVE